MYGLSVLVTTRLHALRVYYYVRHERPLPSQLVFGGGGGGLVGAEWNSILTG